MATITPDSPWRDTGPCPPDDWNRVLRPVFVSTERDAMYDVAGDLSLLCLGQMGPESNYGDSAIYDRTGNLLGLRPRPNDPRQVYHHPTKGDFLKFGSPEECVAEWRSRILDPTYKGGIYTPGTTTILEFVNVYAPAGDGDNDPVAYTDRIVADMNYWIGGAMPMPRLIDLSSPGGLEDYNDLVGPSFALSGAEAADLLSSRVGFHTGRPEGICLHVQQGTTRGSVKDHASAARQASANAYVNLDGTIVLAVSRSFGAWTQGIRPGQSHPSARGKAFLNRVGTTDANEAVLSIEAEGMTDGAHPQAQIEAIVWLCRAWMENWPHITTDLIFKHADFDVVNRPYCPGPYYDTVLALLDGMPPAPGVDYPEGMDEDLATRWFGTVTVDGKVYAYTEGQPVSTLWLEEGCLIGVWPALLAVERYDARTYWRFDGGWTVWRPNDDAPVRVLKE